MPQSYATYKQVRDAARMVRAALGKGWQIRLCPSFDKSIDQWHATVYKSVLTVHLTFSKKGEYYDSYCLVSDRPGERSGATYWTPPQLPHFRRPQEAVAAAVRRVRDFVDHVVRARNLAIQHEYSEPFVPESPYLDQETCNDGGKHTYLYPDEDVEQYCAVCGMQDITIAAIRKDNRLSRKEHAEQLKALDRLLAPLTRKPPKR